MPPSDLPKAPPLREQPRSTWDGAPKRCLLYWPAAFAGFMITMAAVITAICQDPGGLLSWPCACIGSLMLFVLGVGLPVWLLGQRHWALRLIPVETSAALVTAIANYGGWWAGPFGAFIGVILVIEMWARPRRWKTDMGSDPASEPSSNKAPHK